MRRYQQTFFCVGVSQCWTKLISFVLKELWNKYQFKWLRISMSFHIFSNVGKFLNGDLTGKLVEDIDDSTWTNRPCSCNRPNRINGLCVYGGRCRRSVVVCNMWCRLCDTSYIGKIQRHLKHRSAEHVHDVWKVVRSGRDKYGEDNW